MRHHSRRILVLQHKDFRLQAVSVPGWFYILGYPGLGSGLFDVDGMSLAVPYTVYIVQKSAREILETGKSSIRVTERNLEKYLGKEKYSYQMINEKDEIGIVRGLAWTSFGGDTLQTEVNIMPVEGEILLTGQLGDVMKESARTGISYIRSVGEKYKIPEDFFKKHDIHINIPEGAVPKDGPSVYS